MKVVTKKQSKKKQGRGKKTHAELFAPGRHKRIRELGHDRYALVHQYFLDGKSATAIARIIQQDWGELQDITAESLGRELSRLKKLEIDPKILREGQLIPADLQKEIVAKMRGQLDALKEMEQLCIDQTARYKAYALREANTLQKDDAKKAMEIGKQAMAMLKDLAGLQMEAGIIPRAPRVVSAHVNFQRTAAEDAYLHDVQIRKERQTKARTIVDMLTESDVIDAEFEEDTGSKGKDAPPKND